MKKKSKAISMMSYQTRQARYRQEKDELYRKAGSMPPAELQKLLDELISKWRI